MIHHVWTWINLALLSSFFFVTLVNMTVFFLHSAICASAIRFLQIFFQLKKMLFWSKTVTPTFDFSDLSTSFTTSRSKNVHHPQNHHFNLQGQGQCKVTYRSYQFE